MVEGSDAPVNPPVKTDNDFSSVEQFVHDLYSSRNWSSTDNDNSGSNNANKDKSNNESDKDATTSALPVVEFFDDSTDLLSNRPGIKGGAEGPNDGTGGTGEPLSDKATDKKSAPDKPNGGAVPNTDPTTGGAGGKPGGGADAPKNGVDKAPPPPPVRPGNPQEVPSPKIAEIPSLLGGTIDTDRTLTDRLKAEAKASLGLKPEATDAEMRKAIDSEILALGADTYARRELARTKLANAGPAAGEALARAMVNSPDAQIRISSRQLFGRLTGNPEKIGNQAEKISEFRNGTDSDKPSTEGLRKLRNEFFDEHKDVARLTPLQEDGYKHTAAVLNKLSKEWAGTPGAKALENHKDNFIRNEAVRNSLPMNFGTALTGRAYQDFRRSEPQRNAATDASVRDSLQRAMTAYPAITGNHVFNTVAGQLGLDKDPGFVKDYIKAGGQLDNLRNTKR
ncbi:MAG: hypothetical protein K2X93_23525 [Candidatus Obscuribacterales bacterium]|nr:hypothetical protein [Candidatus Obscuribacterales bacterium]